MWKAINKEVENSKIGYWILIGTVPSYEHMNKLKLWTEWEGIFNPINLIGIVIGPNNNTTWSIGSELALFGYGNILNKVISIWPNNYNDWESIICDKNTVSPISQACIIWVVRNYALSARICLLLENNLCEVSSNITLNKLSYKKLLQACNGASMFGDYSYLLIISDWKNDDKNVIFKWNKYASELYIIKNYWEVNIKNEKDIVNNILLLNGNSLEIIPNTIIQKQNPEKEIYNHQWFSTSICYTTITGLSVNLYISIKNNKINGVALSSNQLITIKTLIPQLKTIKIL